MASLWIDAIPIIEPKSNVAVFLDFEHHDAIAEGMNDASLNKNALPTLGYETGQIVIHRMLCEGAQTRSGRTRLQPGVNAARGCGFQNDPSLRFSGLALRNQIGPVVLGMHLHGQHLVHVEKFQRQRKSPESLRQLAENKVRRQFQQLSNGVAFERSIGHPAGMLVAIAQQPGFSDWSIARQGGAEPVRQTPSAPKPVLIDRYEAERIEYGLAHCSLAVVGRYLL